MVLLVEILKNVLMKYLIFDGLVEQLLPVFRGVIFLKERNEQEDEFLGIILVHRVGPLNEELNPLTDGIIDERVPMRDLS